MTNNTWNKELIYSTLFFLVAMIWYFASLPSQIGNIIPFQHHLAVLVTGFFLLLGLSMYMGILSQTRGVKGLAIAQTVLSGLSIVFFLVLFLTIK